MKKILRAVVPIALVGALAGCSATAAVDPAPSATLDPQHPVQIEFWNTFTGPLETSLQKLVGEFERSHPGIRVKLVYQPYDSELQALQTAVAAKKPPALAQLELTSMAQLAAFGALQPVPDLLSKKDADTLKKAVIPAIEDANSYDGTVYTVPMGYNSNVLYYNPNLLRAAGLNVTGLPTTWNSLMQDAAKITKDTNGDGRPDVYGYGFPSQAPWILEVRAWQSGAEVVNAKGTSAEFDSAAGQRMVATYQKAVDDDAAEMVQNDSTLSQLTSLFAAGKIAMFEQSSTAMAGITSTANFQVGVAQFPTMGKKVYSLGGYNLGVFKDAPSDQKAAAAQFAQWWATPEVAAEWTAASNYMPGIDAAWDTDTLKEWKRDDSRRGVAAAQIENARSRPNLPAYPQIATLWANAFQATLSGQGSAKSNLGSAAQKADDILATSGN